MKILNKENYLCLQIIQTNRKMKKILFLLVFLSLSSFIFAQEKKINVALVAFYNIENLFDTIDDPKIDDAEFLPGGLQKWNSEKYLHKLDRLSEVIIKIGNEVVPGGPVILGLSEIENRTVLEDLSKTEKLKSSNYGIVHYDGPDRRGVDVALLYQKSRFTVSGSKSFRLTTSDTSFRTRDQLLVWGKLDGEEFYFLVNHWPSRRGGEKRSAPNRKAAAELGRHIYDSLFKQNPKVNFVLMGDLNDNPNNASVTKHLKSKGNKSDMLAGDLFNPMVKLFNDGIGSYAYRDTWELIDQIIISAPLADENSSSYKLLKVKVFNENFIKQKTGTFAGYPWRTAAGGQYLGGYSDHFPVYAIFGKEVR